MHIAKDIRFWRIPRWFQWKSKIWNTKSCVTGTWCLQVVPQRFTCEVEVWTWRCSEKPGFLKMPGTWIFFCWKKPKAGGKASTRRGFKAVERYRYKETTCWLVIIIAYVSRTRYETLGCNNCKSGFWYSVGPFIFLPFSFLLVLEWGYIFCTIVFKLYIIFFVISQELMM